MRQTKSINLPAIVYFFPYYSVSRSSILQGLIILVMGGFSSFRQFVKKGQIKISVNGQGQCSGNGNWPSLIYDEEYRWIYLWQEKLFAQCRKQCCSSIITKANFLNLTLS